MKTIQLRRWDSAEHLKTPEDMALYLEACLQEAGDDAAFVAKALGNIARAKGMSQLAMKQVWGVKVFIKRYLVKVTQVLPRSLRLPVRSALSCMLCQLTSNYVFYPNYVNHQ